MWSITSVILTTVFLIVQCQLQDRDTATKLLENKVFKTLYEKWAIKQNQGSKDLTQSNSSDDFLNFLLKTINQIERDDSNEQLQEDNYSYTNEAEENKRFYPFGPEARNEESAEELSLSIEDENSSTNNNSQTIEFSLETNNTNGHKIMIKDKKVVENISSVAILQSSQSQDLQTTTETITETTTLSAEDLEIQEALNFDSNKVDTRKQYGKQENQTEVVELWSDKPSTGQLSQSHFRNRKQRPVKINSRRVFLQSPMNKTATNQIESQRSNSSHRLYDEIVSQTGNSFTARDKSVPFEATKFSKEKPVYKYGQKNVDMKQKSTSSYLYGEKLPAEITKENNVITTTDPGPQKGLTDEEINELIMLDMKTERIPMASVTNEESNLPINRISVSGSSADSTSENFAKFAPTDEGLWVFGMKTETKPVKNNTITKENKDFSIESPVSSVVTDSFSGNQDELTEEQINKILNMNIDREFVPLNSNRNNTIMNNKNPKTITYDNPIKISSKNGLTDDEIQELTILDMKTEKTPIKFESDENVISDEISVKRKRLAPKHNNQNVDLNEELSAGVPSHSSGSQYSFTDEDGNKITNITMKDPINEKKLKQNSVSDSTDYRINDELKNGAKRDSSAIKEVTSIVASPSNVGLTEKEINEMIMLDMKTTKVTMSPMTENSSIEDYFVSEYEATAHPYIKQEALLDDVIDEILRLDMKTESVILENTETPQNDDSTTPIPVFMYVRSNFISRTPSTDIKENRQYQNKKNVTNSEEELIEMELKKSSNMEFEGKKGAETLPERVPIYFRQDNKTKNVSNRKTKIHQEENNQFAKLTDEEIVGIMNLESVPKKMKRPLVNTGNSNLHSENQQNSISQEQIKNSRMKHITVDLNIIDNGTNGHSNGQFFPFFTGESST